MLAHGTLIIDREPEHASCHSSQGIRLASVILLAGSVRPSPLQVATERQLIQLPVDPHRTLLDVWYAEVARLAAEARFDDLRLTVLLNGPSPLAPRPDAADGPVPVHIVRDPVELRGTGGLLRDVALDAGDPDDFLLVTSSAQILAQPLAHVFAQVRDTRADAVVVAPKHGARNSVTLIRRRCLQLVPKVGFIDLKEQAMVAIATKYQVTVVSQAGPISAPIRTLDDYIHALRWHHTARVSSPGSAFAETWSPSFSLVGPGASVSAGAQVLDSVVLSGGRVDAGAVVVRSVVCPGGVVPRGHLVADTLVAGVRKAAPTIGRKAGR